MGRPGSGKGMQAKMLAEKLGYPVYSTGAKVREISKGATYLGNRIKEIQEKGELTPPWFASYLFEDALLHLSLDDGLIFEGAGRTESEARLFDEVNGWLGRDYRILYLDVKEESILARLSKRHGVEGRVDDDPERVQTRFKEFAVRTMPALGYFRSIGKVIEIDGEPLPDAVFAQVLSEIQKL